MIDCSNKETKSKTSTNRRTRSGKRVSSARAGAAAAVLVRGKHIGHARCFGFSVPESGEADLLVPPCKADDALDGDLVEALCEEGVVARVKCVVSRGRKRLVRVSSAGRTFDSLMHSPLAFFILLLTRVVLQDADIPSLAPGSVSGIIQEADSSVDTPTIRARFANAVVRGDAYRLEVEPGTWTFELVSLDFDTFLVMTDVNGEVVAEDDDGFYGTHSRFVVEVAEGAGYVVRACALHGVRGEYELRLIAGRTPELSLEERTRRANGEHAQRVARAADTFGVDSVEHADALYAWGKANLRGRYKQAVEVLLQAIPIYEKLGAWEPLALAMNDAGDALGALGRWSEAVDWVRHAYEILANDPKQAPARIALVAFNVGYCHVELEEYDRALEYLERALELRTSVFGARASLTYEARSKLATALRNAGEWPRFLEFFPETRILTVGEPVKGEILALDLHQRTVIVRNGYSAGWPRTDVHRVRVEDSGWYTIELRPSSSSARTFPARSRRTR